MIAAWFAANGLRVGLYAALVLGLMGFGAYKMHQHDAKAYDALETTYLTFKAGVEAEGKRAQKEADKQKAADLAAKEKADAKAKTDLAAVTAERDSLRKQRANSNYVPPATPGARDPDRACFSRTQLERTIQQLDADVQGLIGEGDQARVILDAAKTWAQRR